MSAPSPRRKRHYDDGHRKRRVTVSVVDVQRLAKSVDDFDGNGQNARCRVADGAERLARQVDDASFGIGATVIDSYDDAFSVSGIRDPDHGPKGQLPVGASKCVFIVRFAAGCRSSLELVGIVGSLARLAEAAR